MIVRPPYQTFPSTVTGSKVDSICGWLTSVLNSGFVVSTKTEIVVCKDYHAEIRKITFKNEDDTDKELELTSYTEPILSENMDDVSHRVFNNMFI